MRMASALLSASADRNPGRTAIAEASGTVDSYVLRFEAVDELAHALPSVFGVVFGQPFPELEI